MTSSNILVRFYQKLSKEYMTLLHSFEAGCLMCTGDLIAQTVIEEKKFKDVDKLRSAQFFTLGTVIVGPSLSVWYKFLAKNIKQEGKFWVVKKVAIDQLTFAPCLMATLITSINLLEGNNFQYAVEQLKLKYFDVMSTNYKVWPFVQLCNFYFVPLKHQVLLVQSVALFWNAYLSWKTKQGKEPTVKTEDEESSKAGHDEK